MSQLVSSSTCSALAATSTTCASSSSIERNSEYCCMKEAATVASTFAAIIDYPSLSAVAGSSPPSQLPSPTLSTSHSKCLLDADLCELTALEFESKGNLLFKDSFKLIIQYGPYVLKEILLLAVVPPSSIEGNNSDGDGNNNGLEVSAAAKTMVNQKQQQQQDIHLKRLNKFCETLQNEMKVTTTINEQRLNSNRGNQQVHQQNHHIPLTCHYILPPLAFGRSPTRCVLLSPFMSERDAWVHLIQKNQNLFKYLEDPSREEQQISSDFQRMLLTRSRFILFGTMKLTYYISTALSYLHDSLDLAHNDVKPDNFFAHAGEHPLLLQTTAAQDKSVNNSEDDDGVVYYLSDLGFAKPTGFASSRDVKRFFLQKQPTYLSPEILTLLNDGHLHADLSGGTLEKSSDVFAFGVSLFQILFQTNPFQHNGCSPSDYYYSLLESNPIQFWQTIAKQLSVYDSMTDTALLKDLLSGMLQRNPTSRLTATQVLNHPWLQDIKHYLFQGE